MKEDPFYFVSCLFDVMHFFTFLRAGSVLYEEVPSREEVK